jgi:hypothetical protein
MAWHEDVEAIRQDIAELRAALDASDLRADARVTALASIVDAKTMLLAIETFHANRDGIVEDVIRPLTLALDRFPEAAEDLATGLHRLPDR